MLIAFRGCYSFPYNLVAQLERKDITRGPEELGKSCNMFDRVRLCGALFARRALFHDLTLDHWMNAFEVLRGTVDTDPDKIERLQSWRTKRGDQPISDRHVQDTPLCKTPPLWKGGTMFGVILGLNIYHMGYLIKFDGTHQNGLGIRCIYIL